MDSFDHVAGRIEHWGRERGITDNGTIEGQANKTMEECREVLQAIRENDDNLLEDGLGDVGVAWLMMCFTAGRDPIEMLYIAYEEIRDRRGHMNEEGIFVKEDPSKVA